MSRTHRTLPRWCLAVLAAAVATSAQAGTLAEVTAFGDNPGGLRMYLYLPDQLAADPALVVALHGCGQQAADYASAGWNALAESHGFVVVYPQQTTVNNYYRCFTWWGSELTRGEDENQSIKNMVDHAVASHGVDPARVFVTGLSAGGAVAINLLAMWPDVFAAGGVVAGIPYGCATSLNATSACISPGVDRTAGAWGQLVRDAHAGVSGGYPRVSLWQGTADSVVSSANLGELTEQWLDAHALSTTPALDETAGTVRHQVYRGAQGADLVEVYTLQGVDHGTPVDPEQGCGSAGAYFLDLDLCSAERMARFFGLVAVDAGPQVDGGGDGGIRDVPALDVGPGADRGSPDDATTTRPDAAALDSAGDDVGTLDAGAADTTPGADATAQDPTPDPGCSCRGDDSGAGTSVLVLLGACVWGRAARGRRAFTRRA